MNQLLKLFLVITLFASQFVSCKKDDLKVTEYGLYKFAAKINGENFIPSQDIFSTTAFIRLDRYAGSTQASNDLLFIVHRAEDHASLYLSVKDVTGAGKYPLDAFFEKTVDFSQPSWKTNNIDTGFMEITQYSSRIRTNFSFTARNREDSSVINVNGFFNYN